MRILITGGAGFIGSKSAARYIQRGDKVVVLDNLSRKGTEVNLKWLRSVGDFKFIQTDIRDYTSLIKIFGSGDNFDIMLHLAAQVAVTTSVANPREDFEVNALGTLNLLEAVKNSGRNPIFIFSSTNKVYGSLENIGLIEGEKAYGFKGGVEAISEEHPLDFHSPYGCSKGCADQYVRDYTRIYGLRTVVLRQSCIYGPRQFGVEDQGWIAWFMIAHLLGKPITIYGNGKQVRDVLYIDDLLDCFDRVVENIEMARGRIYNIGGGPENQISLLRFLDLLSELSGQGVKPEYSNCRLGDQKIYVSDITKAGEELSWEPLVGIREGIQKLYNWILAHKSTVQKVLDGTL